MQKIILIIDTNKNINNQTFKLIHEHSLEYKQKEKIKPLYNEVILEWDDYKNICINNLQRIDIFIKEKCLDFCKAIYQSKKYNFAFSEKKVIQLIKNWKKNSIKFTINKSFI